MGKVVYLQPPGVRFYFWESGGYFYGQALREEKVIAQAYEWDDPAFPQVGYDVWYREEEGKGLMTSLMRAFCRYKQAPVRLVICPRNTASVRVAQKCGFVLTKVGAWDDTFIWRPRYGLKYAA